MPSYVWASLVLCLGLLAAESTHNASGTATPQPINRTADNTTHTRAANDTHTPQPAHANSTHVPTNNTTQTPHGDEELEEGEIGHHAEEDDDHHEGEDGHEEGEIEEDHDEHGHKEIDEHESASQKFGWVTTVGSHGIIMRSTNAGNTWEFQKSGSSAHFFDVDFHDASAGLVVGSQGTILYTFDGGMEWTDMSPGIPHVSLYATHMISRRRFITVGSAGHIVKTQDTGSQWIVSKLDVDTDLLTVHFVDLFTGFTAGRAGVCGQTVRVCDPMYNNMPTSVLFRTEDAGHTWKFLGHPNHTYNGVQRPPPSIRGVVFHASNILHGHAFSDDGQMLTTLDGGSKWENTDYLETAVFTSGFVSDRGLTLCGYYGVSHAAYIFRWLNGEWTEISNHLPDVGFTALFFLDPEEAMLTSSDGALHLLHEGGKVHTTVYSTGNFTLYALDGQTWSDEVGGTSALVAPSIWVFACVSIGFQLALL